MANNTSDHRMVQHALSWAALSRQLVLVLVLVLVNVYLYVLRSALAIPRELTYARPRVGELHGEQA